MKNEKITSIRQILHKLINMEGGVSQKGSQEFGRVHKWDVTNTQHHDGSCRDWVIPMFSKLTRLFIIGCFCLSINMVDAFAQIGNDSKQVGIGGLKHAGVRRNARVSCRLTVRRGRRGQQRDKCFSLTWLKEFEQRCRKHLDIDYINELKNDIEKLEVKCSGTELSTPEQLKNESERNEITAPSSTDRSPTELEWDKDIGGSQSQRNDDFEDDSGAKYQNVPNNIPDDFSNQTLPGFEELFPEEATIVIATGILIVVGFGVMYANSIAVAIAQLTQTGGETGIEEIAETSEDQQDDPHNNGPPIINPVDGTPFEQNENGQYLSPDDDGNWLWMSSEEAHRAADALRGETELREAEQALHDKTTGEIREQWRNDIEAENLAQQARELTARDAQHSEKAQAKPSATFQTIDVPMVVTPGIDNTGFGWGINFVKDFLGGSVQDTVTLIVESPGALANVISTAADAVLDELKDPENWTIAKETLRDTASDLHQEFTNPGNWTIAAETVVETSKDIGGSLIGSSERANKVATAIEEGAKVVDEASKFVEKVSIQAAKAFAKDPAGNTIAITKAVLGADNWAKAIDPDVPVTERMARSLWGVIDTGGTIVGVGTTVIKGGAKLINVAKAIDKFGDLSKGAKLSDALSDASKGVRALESSTDIAKGVDLADDAGDIAKAARSTESTGDVAKQTSVAGASASAVDDGRDLAKATDAVQPTSSKNLWDEKFSDGRPDGENIVSPGIPDMATDPEDYIKGLPSGAHVDRNLAHGTGYSGAQIDDMARMAKEEGVIIGSRSTNMDSMRHIRDGTGVPKPLTIKSKTINDLDVYLGAKPEDKGLVGYFRPKRPDESKVPQNILKAVRERYDERLIKYKELSHDVHKMIDDGIAFEKDGVLHKMIKNSDGTTTMKPYAGDIDAVYFKDTKPPYELIPPGEKYDRLKQAWMGKGKDTPSYWSSDAPGQHGVETNIVADMTEGLEPGTSVYKKALDKALEILGDLGKNHELGKETVLEMGPDGILRRGMRFTPKKPLPDLSL